MFFYTKLLAEIPGYMDQLDYTEYHNYHTKASHYTIYGTPKREVLSELRTISTQHATTVPWDSQVK
jgi:hypothetical protein